MGKNARFALLAGALLAAGALAARAEMQWIEKPRFKPDAAAADTLAFSVTIEEGGSYAARILVRGEEGKRYVLRLVLLPEAGGDPQSVEFSFTGSGCG